MAMDTKELKRLFGQVAAAHGFAADHGGWFQGTKECVIVLDLQKSNYANRYELNVKVFVQGMFGEQYGRTKQMVKRHMGSLFTRPPGSYKPTLNLDSTLSYEERKASLEVLFRDFIVPFTTEALSREGIFRLAARDEVLLLPAVRKELERLSGDA